MDPTWKRDRMERFEQLCRQRGLSLTVQRRAILDAVLDRTDHPTADRIYEEVKERIPGVSRTTVYRVLDTLVEVGAITRACGPGAATRYDAMTERHHHLVCLRCEKLIDVSDAQFPQRIEMPDVRSLDFQIHDVSIHFLGICADCRRAQADDSKGHKGTGTRGAARSVKSKASASTKRRKKA